MTLAQVQGTVALVFGLVASWAGLMIAVALLWPQQTNRAEAALEHSTKRCFLSALLMLLLFAGFIALANAPLPILKLVGIFGMLAEGGLMALGAAGLAQLMGRRIGEMSGARTSFGTLVRGSVVYSLAMFFPLVGWWLFAPLSAVFALGAGTLAVWPRRHRSLTPPETAFGGQGAV